MQVAKYIYICSAGHSGSTLLDLIIGSHSQIESLGEVAQLPKNVSLDTTCSCGQPVRSCPLWLPVLERLGGELGIDLLKNPYALHMGYVRASSVVDRAHQTRVYLLQRKIVLGLYYLRLRLDWPILDRLTKHVLDAIDNNVRVFEAVRSVTGADAVVDSSKSYLKALALYRRHPDRVRILLLTRDGRAVMWSNLKRGATRRDAVHDWSRHYSRALPLLRQFVRREHMLHVRYEELARSTPETVRTICKFVGMPFEPGMLDFRSKVHHLANGNRMRMSRSSEIRLDEQWQASLAPDDRRYFERQAGPLNRELGYS